jgi:hypothetical protein
VEQLIGESFISALLISNIFKILSKIPAISGTYHIGSQLHNQTLSGKFLAEDS